VTPKLYKAGDVCELLHVQPYVLRSWEKEFPGIGVQGKSPDAPRLYRQSDVDHVQKIKQLVFGEGLTVAGARRKLEAEAPTMGVVSEAEAAEVLDALGADVRDRIATVRNSLRELQSMLSGSPLADSPMRSANGHASRPAVKRKAPKRRAAAAKRTTIRKVKASAAQKKKAPRKRVSGHR
jgi:DNA-binding transcriptional MerR regulator